MKIPFLTLGDKTAAPWYQEGLRFECVRCGGCCRGEPGYVWVREIEIAAIARFLRHDVAEFTKTYVRREWGDWALVELANGDCVFWSPQGCRIYPVRPAQCRTFPFWREYVQSARGWALAARRCPGVNKGTLRLPAEIEHLVEVTDQ